MGDVPLEPGEFLTYAFWCDACGRFHSGSASAPTVERMATVVCPGCKRVGGMTVHRHTHRLLEGGER
jgi:hypothetical protein